MLLIAVRDAVWRWRRFLVALVATALVLGLTLVLDGVSRSFGNEVRRTVEAFDAESWVVAEGATGVFLNGTLIPADVVKAIGGPDDASPMAFTRAALGDGTDVNVLGIEPGAFTEPPLEDGRAPAAPGEATVETSTGLDLGEAITLGGRPFTVVGRTSGLSYRAGVPSAYVALSEVQAISFRGAPLITAVVSRVPDPAVPEGLTVLTNDEVAEDLISPVVNARKTIKLVLVLLWLVAAMVIGSVVYLTSLDRTRDFAVLKATGATDRSLLGGLALQSSLLSGGAFVVGMALSAALAPAMPMRSEVATSSYLTLLGVAIGVSVVASVVSARRTLRIDPALAFSGA